MASTLDLFVNLSNPVNRALLANSGTLSVAPNPQLVVRDNLTVRIRFFTVEAGARSPSNFDPGAGVTVAFGAKTAAAFQTETTFLFYSASFTRDATDPADVFFTTDVNLNTTEFIAAFGTSPNVGQSIAIRGEIELEDDGSIQTAAQFAASGLYDVIRGAEPSPTAATPPYPVAPVADTLLGGNSDGTAWITYPISASLVPRVVSGNATAVVNELLHVTATATISDPASPVQGRGFTVVVRNGTATVGGVAYATAGTVVRRVFHSGAYTNYVEAPAASQATVDAGTDAIQPVSPLTLHGYVNPRLAARAPLDYIQMDGATANRASGIAVPGARGNLAGFPGAVTAWALVRVPETNPAVDIHFEKLQSNTTANFLANSVNSLVTTAGAFAINAFGATTGDFRAFTYTGFRAAYSGRLVLLEIAWPAGNTATDPTIYADGVDITASFTLTTAGTPPNWFDSALVGTNHITGFNWVAGRAPLGAFGFGSFTPTERAEIVRTGTFPAWWMAGGSAVDRTPTGISVTFGAADGGTTGLTQVGAGGGAVSLATIAGTRTGGAGAFVLQVTSNGIGSFSEYSNWSIPQGRPVTVRLWARRTSGSAASLIVGISTVAGLTADWTEFSVATFGRGTASNGLMIGISSAGAGEVVEIDDLQLFLNGAITHPAPLRDTLMSADATGLGNVPSRIVGGTVVSTDAPCTVPLTIDYAYTGASINLLGGTVLPAGTVWEVVSVTGTSNASVNLSIGTSTGGTQIVNAQAITAAPFRIGTYASQIINATAATGLWLTASGNVAGRISIQLRKV